MLSTLLLAWYDQNRRTLPFRGTKDPYRVWVSEIMLQQTRTETVGPYYLRFLSLFPDVFALARAPEQEVLKAWEGLGYYSRARNLRRAAQVIAEEYGGAFPEDPGALRALPGVGDYTAAAVASIAFDAPAPALDGNLTRVLSRVHGVREDVGMPSVRRTLLSLAREDMPDTRCGDFNQALMDLGAMICVPGTPECDRCPLRPLCDACRAGDADQLPVKAAAAPPRDVSAGVAVVTCGARTLLMERKEALLRGLWVFPMTEEGAGRGDMEKRLRALGVRARLVGPLGEARHVFTHRVWHMTVSHYIADQPQAKEGRWATLSEMNALPLPTAMRFAKEQAAQLLTPRIVAVTEETLPSVAAAYAESWRDAHAIHCSPAFLAEHTPLHMEMILRGHLDAGKQVYGIQCAGETAGVLVLDPEENELVSLYIRPAFQDAGLGRAAVSFAVAALDTGRDMRVTVLADNPRAQRLYRSFGFDRLRAQRVLNPERDVREMDLIREGEGKPHAD